MFLIQGNDSLKQFMSLLFSLLRKNSKEIISIFISQLINYSLRHTTFLLLQTIPLRDLIIEQTKIFNFRNDKFCFEIHFKFLDIIY